MKQYLITAISLLLIFFSHNLAADQIHLKDGSVINGKIIQVTPKTIEFDPEGSRPFDVLVRDQVIMIKYDDGTIVNLNTPAQAGIKDGSRKDTENTEETGREEDKRTDTVRNKRETQQEGNGFIWFVGPESGWNNYSGLGVRFEFPIGSIFSLNAGSGLGMWGWRSGGGIRYYPWGCPFGSAIGLGATYNGGLGKQKEDAELTDEYGNTETREVEIDYKPVSVINITYIYSWNIYNDNKIYIEAGYGIRLSKTEDNYEIKDPNDPNARIVLSKEAKNDMDILQPGGFIFAVGIAW